MEPLQQQHMKELGEPQWPGILHFSPAREMLVTSSSDFPLISVGNFWWTLQGLFFLKNEGAKRTKAAFAAFVQFF
jgi:hypothetical protein